MLRRFGGVGGFCQAWTEHLATTPAGSRWALQAFSAVFKLLEIAEAEWQSQDYSVLSDEEIEQEIRRHVGGREGSS
jgi:hypothetical protein